MKTSILSEYINVMVDLETASTANDAAILQIGATVFGQSSEEVNDFNKYASLLSNEQLGFDISKSTLDWWDKQDKELREKVFGSTKHITDTLLEFSLWLRDLESVFLGKKVMLWGNGATFDNVILRNAFDRVGIKVPWSYRNDMCYRTMKNLYPFIQPLMANGTKHDALSDAKYQAAHLEKILSYMNNGTTSS